MKDLLLKIDPEAMPRLEKWAKAAKYEIFTGHNTALIVALPENYSDLLNEIARIAPGANYSLFPHVRQDNFSAAKLLQTKDFQGFLIDESQID